MKCDDKQLKDRVPDMMTMDDRETWRQVMETRGMVLEMSQLRENTGLVFVSVRTDI